MISNNGNCKVASGKYPFNCDRANVTSKSICEDHCTAMSSCVGYDYCKSLNLCELFPSVRSCPSGFNEDCSREDSGQDCKSAPITTKMNDFMASSNNWGWVCYGKIR